jgi:hypothetical protein
MLRKVKGKWLCGYKDTWCLDHTLSPIILASLLKFKAVITEEGCDYRKGLPAAFVTPETTGSDAEWEKQHDVWLACLDKMIYAFDPSVEPDFDIKFKDGPRHKEVDSNGLVRYDRVPVDEAAHEQYRAASMDYEIKRQEGLELFGQFYTNLWW